MNKTIQRAALHAARAGWIPLWCALGMVSIMGWIGAAFIHAACDQCKSRIPHRGVRGLAVHLHTHRVDLAKHWSFCSDRCRERWLSSGAAEDLHAIVDDSIPYDPVPFTSDDGEVQVSVFYDDGPGSVVHGVAVRDAAGEIRFGLMNGRLILSVVLASPSAVNAWWRSPAWMTTGLVEVCADHREAA